MSEIAEAAFQYQTALEKGDKKIVGVNVHTDSVTDDLEILRVSHEVERRAGRALWPSGVRRVTTPRSQAALVRTGRGRPRPRQHDPADARRVPAPRRPSARSATCYGPSGASTASRLGSGPRPARLPRMAGMTQQPFSRPGRRGPVGTPGTRPCRSRERCPPRGGGGLGVHRRRDGAEPPDAPGVLGHRSGGAGVLLAEPGAREHDVRR
ncbi:MAG: methylmalonyl-CoA mutase family protein [Nocardioides sp.]